MTYQEAYTHVQAYEHQKWGEIPEKVQEALTTLYDYDTSIYKLCKMTGISQPALTRYIREQFEVKTKRIEQPVKKKHFRMPVIMDNKPPLSCPRCNGFIQGCTDINHDELVVLMQWRCIMCGWRSHDK